MRRSGGLRPRGRVARSRPRGRRRSSRPRGHGSSSRPRQTLEVEPSAPNRQSPDRQSANAYRPRGRPFFGVPPKAAPGGLCRFIPPGEVSEWLKEHAWKACVPATVPRVRIPLSPQSEMRSADLEVGGALPFVGASPSRPRRWWTETACRACYSGSLCVASALEGEARIAVYPNPSVGAATVAVSGLAPGSYVVRTTGSALSDARQLTVAR